MLIDFACKLREVREKIIADIEDTTKKQISLTISDFRVF